MQKILPILVLLLLTACDVVIQVQDLGESWNEGQIDRAFLGKWSDAPEKSSEALFVANHGGMYRIVSPERLENAHLAKTLIVGRYDFYMEGGRSTYTWWTSEGLLCRYLIKGDRLQFYMLEPRAMRQLLLEKFPEETNVFIGRACTKGEKDTSCYEYVGITKLDADALAILSGIPNTDAYWVEATVFTRIHE